MTKYILLSCRDELIKKRDRIDLRVLSALSGSLPFHLSV